MEIEQATGQLSKTYLVIREDAADEDDCGQGESKIKIVILDVSGGHQGLQSIIIIKSLLSFLGEKQ